MPVYKGRKTAPRRVEVCAIGCEAESLDAMLKRLNADGWNIRQLHQEDIPGRALAYRIFAQRETPVNDPDSAAKTEAAEAIIRENPSLTIRKIEELLRAAKCGKCRDWIMATKARLGADTHRPSVLEPGIPAHDGEMHG